MLISIIESAIKMYNKCQVCWYKFQIIICIKSIIGKLTQRSKCSKQGYRNFKSVRISLKSGLEITYKWIENEIAKKLNNNKFTIKY